MCVCVVRGSVDQLFLNLSMCQTMYVCIYICIYISISLYIYIYILNHEFALMFPIPIQTRGFNLDYSFPYLPLPSLTMRNFTLSILNVFTCSISSPAGKQTLDLGREVISLNAFFPWLQTLLATFNKYYRKGRRKLC